MKKDNSITYVTEPSLPSLEDYIVSLKKIWDNKILTNKGPFHDEFEQELARHLGVKYISVFNNGTIALLTALQALEIKGEVITTPYSFVATAHSLIWNNLTPVFCDINPLTGNMLPEEIEKHITPNTAAILPVHVYGNPCDVDSIAKLAEKHQLKVIYDAAHAFGVKLNGTSILNYGDLAVLSFHATKTFNSVEGGAIVCNTAEMKQKIDQLKNFGITDEVTVVSPGINGKMNELIAAYGLLQLKNISLQIKQRKKASEYYTKHLKNILGIRLLTSASSVEQNYSYYPIFIDKNNYGITRDELYLKLKENNIYGRRYFYPLISNFPTYQHLKSSDKNLLPQANKLAEEVLCLPIFASISVEVQDQIINIIKTYQKK